MIVFNFTGLPRFYWWPQFKRETDREGLWYSSVRWLGVEVIAYSVIMGAEFIRRMNVDMKEPLPPRGDLKIEGDGVTYWIHNGTLWINTDGMWRIYT